MHLATDFGPGSPRVLCLVTSVGLLSVAAPASAEWFADLYAGVAYTPKSDVTLVVRPPSGPADHTFQNVKWTTSATLGGRVGYWFEARPWIGLGLDVFHFNADIPTQTVSATILGLTAPATLRAIDVSVTAVGLDLLQLRYPFQASPEFPNGRFQPYLTAGPTLFWTRAANKGNPELSTQAATDSSVGLGAGAGVSWMVGRSAALFAEYRYTHVNTEPVLNSALSTLRVPMQFDLSTHHLLAGISYRF